MIENLDRLSGLYLKHVPDKGFGLFCRDIIIGETILEVAPAIVFNETDAAAINKTHLYNYYFLAKSLAQEDADILGISEKDKTGLLALGAVSMCNHSDKPNAAVQMIVKDRAVYFILRATIGILAHQEICISYGGGKLWFDPAPEKGRQKSW